MRLFVAILPDAQVQKALLDVVDNLKRQGVSANYTRQNNLHLTLAFLGESDRPDGALRAMERAASTPFSLELSGFGRFGELFWVGAKKDPGLLSLAERLRTALEAEGVYVEKGAFRPQITVARRALWQEPLRIKVAPAAMTVRHISLMCSLREKGRLVYEEVGAVALRPEAKQK